jgi:hypothetical protein
MSNVHPLPLSYAIEQRNPQAVADALLRQRDIEAQAQALLAVLYECSMIEVKHIHAWAEDWLSFAINNALRERGDIRWQAMNTVYHLAEQAIKASGATLRRERLT